MAVQISEKGLHFPGLRHILGGLSVSSMHTKPPSFGNDVGTRQFAGQDACTRRVIGADCYDSYCQSFPGEQAAEYKIAADVGLNAQVLSLDMLELIGADGKLDGGKVAEKRKFIEQMKKDDITVIGSIWHFCNPVDFDKKGGIANPENISAYVSYTKEVAVAFGDLVNYWQIANEANVFAFGWLSGDFYREKKYLPRIFNIVGNLISFHRQAYDAIHAVYNEKKFGKVMVSTPVQFFDPHPHHTGLLGMAERGVAEIYKHIIETNFLNQIVDKMDFISIHQYSSVPIVDTKNLTGLVPIPRFWTFRPEGLANTVEYVYQYVKKLTGKPMPIMITETGWKNDNRYRNTFISLLTLFSRLQANPEISRNFLGVCLWTSLPVFDWAERANNLQMNWINVDQDTKKRTPTEEVKILGAMFRELRETGVISWKLLNQADLTYTPNGDIV